MCCLLLNLKRVLFLPLVHPGIIGVTIRPVEVADRDTVGVGLHGGEDDGGQTQERGDDQDEDDGNQSSPSPHFPRQRLHYKNISVNRL